VHVTTKTQSFYQQANGEGLQIDKNDESTAEFRKGWQRCVAKLKQSHIVQRTSSRKAAPPSRLSPKASSPRTRNRKKPKAEKPVALPSPVGAEDITLLAQSIGTTIAQQIQTSMGASQPLASGHEQTHRSRAHSHSSTQSAGSRPGTSSRKHSKKHSHRRNRYYYSSSRETDLMANNALLLHALQAQRNSRNNFPGFFSMY
jgi:hypothetical protein